MVFLWISLLCGVWFWVLFKYKQEWEPKCVTNRWGHNQEDSDWADNWCFIQVVTYVTLCWLSNWFTNLLHCQIGQYIKTNICVKATNNGSMFLGFKSYWHISCALAGKPQTYQTVNLDGWAEVQQTLPHHARLSCPRKPRWGHPNIWTFTMLQLISVIH